MRRIFRDDGRTVIVPMDHAVAVGPIEGLMDVASTMAELARAQADSVLVHVGVARAVDTHGMGLIIHLTGSTRLNEEPNWKAQVSSVKDAIRVGADAVSVQINVGSLHEQKMLEAFSGIADDCNEYGVPLLAMVYPRGPAIKNEHGDDVVSHAVRLGYEIGADFIQTNYTGSQEGFKRALQGVRVPVVVVGGPKTESIPDLLEMVFAAMGAGASGVSIGRNVFQHQRPYAMVKALGAIVHEAVDGRKAMQILDLGSTIR
jgi:predicted phospho-2-dehydro-3-deoxyheptonate aldolase